MSVRDRLVLLFFAITAAAIAFIYVYVVPQLRNSLIAQKLSRQETAAEDVTERLGAAMGEGASQAELRQLVRRLAQETDTRLTLLGAPRAGGSPSPPFVIADSDLERTAVLPSYVPASAAAAVGGTASGVEIVSGQRLAETAIGIPAGEDAPWVAVLSSTLADVDDNVTLIRRQILIAGGIALALAAIAGSFAARAHARRLRRLESAAEAVAEGNFDVEIPAGSRDEVGQLGTALNEMQKRLARLDSARREFIATASHELRTPIFSLGGFLELLETDDPDPAARKEFARAMRQQIDRLTKLATELLDLSKLDSDAIEISVSTIDLARLAREIGDEFRPTAERGGRTVTLDQVAADSPVAYGDADRVGQILRILLDNALSHTPEGTTITVTTSRQDERAAVVVSDDGPGIDPDSRARVFERFYTGTETTGSGLGLAIAHELAELMDGSLDVSSQPGRTAFSLELPAAS